METEIEAMGTKERLIDACQMIRGVSEILMILENSRMVQIPSGILPMLETVLKEAERKIGLAVDGAGEMKEANSERDPDSIDQQCIHHLE